LDIQLFVPTFRVEECLQEIRECLEKGWTGLGFKTLVFEEAWKQYSGLPHAHFVNSATSGLHLAVHILKKQNKWLDGDEIITTPITFVSTNHVIMYENLKPVFADVDEYVCLDPEDVLRKISPRTRAVMFVGLGGNSGRYGEIVNICRKYKLSLILDAAHMSGSRINGKQAGKEAEASIFSFQAVKNLPTADGGMVCFASPEDDKIARKLSWLGIDKDTYSRSTAGDDYKWLYDVEYTGFKYHGNSIMAAIGLVQLKYLDQDNSFRRQLSDWYTNSLKGIPAVEPVPIAPGCEPSRHLYQVMVEDRNNLILSLNKKGVHPGVHYRDNTDYIMYRYGRNTCPNAQKISEKILSLPLHLRMVKSDIERVADLVSAYYNKNIQE
jgi:dTDP-4-amino-4,6-dideoxygalactose transaminase